MFCVEHPVRPIRNERSGKMHKFDVWHGGRSVGGSLRNEHQTEIWNFRFRFSMIFLARFFPSFCVVRNRHRLQQKRTTQIAKCSNSIIWKYYTFPNEMLCRCKACSVLTAQCQKCERGVSCSILFPCVCCVWCFCGSSQKTKTLLIFFVAQL